MGWGYERPTIMIKGGINMKIGTKSLLFGIHQVFWHPFVVYRAWKHLYGRPSWKEFVCIFIHDWGYWGKPNLDGEEGVEHPKLGGKIACRLLGYEYHNLCIGHSRTYANKYSYPISKLCWADKFSFYYEPKWFYILRAKMSGEMKEVYEQSLASGWRPDEMEWYDWMKQYSALAAYRGINSQK